MAGSAQLCCPRPCGNTRYPLASAPCPPTVGGDVPRLSGACVSWGLGADLGAAGSPRVRPLYSESRPCRFCHQDDGLGHEHQGALGRRVSVPSPITLRPLGAESCVLPSCSQCTGETGRRHGHVYRH